MLEIYPEKIRRPNHFEFFGNKVLATHLKDLLDEFPGCVCLKEPVLTVVTVNKVQDLYNTPVYNLEEGTLEIQLLLLMNKYFKDKVDYD